MTPKRSQLQNEQEETKVVEDDAFFDQLLPDEEDEFDFGIVDEDEEYERFRSFFDPQLADDSISDSDDDDYAPDKDEELDDDSDNEEEEKRSEM